MENKIIKTFCKTKNGYISKRSVQYIFQLKKRFIKMFYLSILSNKYDVSRRYCKTLCDQKAYFFF